MGGVSERHAARLTREAQALAKLSHPNVVHVYEVGQADGHWFIAMELVPGRTLRDALAQWQRDHVGWRERVRVYLQAGAGLQAAHEAGLVHRDFKPDNCIVDEQGRVRVLDFGLVRETGVPSLDSDASNGTRTDVSALRVPLTQVGTVLGTPAYMPLEQLAGRPTDARSDQFSFCVSLYEALYGERPFTDESLGALTVALTRGEIGRAPKGTRVPARLRRVLLRGLSVDPGERWPSMEALLDELRRVVAPTRVVAPALVVGVGVVIASVVWSWPPAEAGRPCEGAAAQLEGVWDAARRQAVEMAVVGTELPYAAQTWALVEPMLDDYARAWTSEHTEACEATSVRQEQSAEIMDLRMGCLQQRRIALREAVGVLAAANETRVKNAVSLVSGLPGISRCGDLEALRSALAPPEDPRVAAQVEGLRERLGRASSLQDAGEYGEGLAEAEAVVVQADALEHAPLQVEAWFRRGALRGRQGQYEDAERDLEQAYLLALEIGHDELDAAAAVELTWLVGNLRGRHEQGLWWGKTGLAMARGLRVPLREADALQAVGIVRMENGDYEEALAVFERSLAIREGELGSEHLAVGDTVNSLGNVLTKLGRYEEALAQHRRALAIRTQALSPQHPLLANSLVNLGNVLASRGAHEDALEHFRRALTIKEEALGPRHPDLVNVLNSIGAELVVLGRPAEAIPHFERALALGEGPLGPLHPSIASVHESLGVALREQGRFEEALAHLQRALASREEGQGLRHPSVATALVNLAGVLSGLGRPAEALEHYERALSIHEETLGPHHPQVAALLNNLGTLQLASGELDAALASHERASAGFEAALGPDHPNSGAAQGSIGIVLRAQGKHAEAMAHQRRALAVFEAALGPRHHLVASSLVELAEVSLITGDVSAARRDATRAEEILADKELGADALARARKVLARTHRE